MILGKRLCDLVVGNRKGLDLVT